MSEGKEIKKGEPVEREPLDMTILDKSPENGVKRVTAYYSKCKGDS